MSSVVSPCGVPGGLGEQRRTRGVLSQEGPGGCGSSLLAGPPGVLCEQGGRADPHLPDGGVGHPKEALRKRPFK